MINPMRSQPTRMMGLASGMDTDFIIQQTLKMHQFKIDNQLRNRKLIEWRQQTHNTIRDEIQSMRSTFLSNLGTRSMMNRNAFNATVASVSGNDRNAVSIRTNAGSPLGNLTINSVEKLAKGAHLTTAKGASASGNGFATGTRLGDLEFANGGKITWTHDGATVKVGNTDVKIERTTGGVWSFTGDGATGSVSGNTMTLTAGDTTRTLNIVTDENGAMRLTEDRPGVFNHNFTVPNGEDGTRPVTVTTALVNGVMTFTSSVGTANLDENGDVIVRIGSGDNLQIHNLGRWDEDSGTIGGSTPVQATSDVVRMFGEARLTFNTGGDDVNVLIRATDTLSEMITRVNNSAAGVNMSYDRLTDQFTLEAKTGTNIDPTGTSLGLFSNSNFLNAIRGNVSEIELTEEEIEAGITSPPIVRAGQKAVVFINGTERIESNTNSFDFRGVGITLNDTFEASEGAIGVNLTRNTDAAFNNIRDFINSYNAIISRLEGLLNERKTGNEVSYRPLTDEEKQGMTDRQIEEWEAIARKGIMRNDQGIQNLVNSLRRSFFDEIEGMGLSPSQIGLTTGSYFDNTGGQIMINEERLRAAIEEDPDMVADIFIRIDSSDGGAKGVGLLYKIDGLMRDFVNTTQSTSTKGLEDSLKRVNEQIERMQARMFAEEDRLYRVFASMETAMQRMQQQGGWFQAMLGQ